MVQGQALSLKVGASGGGLTYQWLSNNVALSDGGYVSGSGTQQSGDLPGGHRQQRQLLGDLSNSGGAHQEPGSVVTGR